MLYCIHIIMKNTILLNLIPAEYKFVRRVDGFFFFSKCQIHHSPLDIYFVVLPLLLNIL